MRFKRIVRADHRLEPMEELEQYSLSQCLRSAHEARGVCLWASVELAAKADVLGLTEQVQLLRWRLKGDPEFVEHWALKVSASDVLDLTAVQVDGNPTPWRSIDSYPHHFGKPSQYPIHLVLPYARADMEDGRIARHELWRLHRALAKYELRIAINRRTFFDAAFVGLGFLGETTRLGLSHLLKVAIARLSKMLRRLQ